jgi:hypothetical protein
MTHARSFASAANGADIPVRAGDVCAWARDAREHGQTIVTLRDGERLHLVVPFREFHAWVTAPAKETRR